MKSMLRNPLFGNILIALYKEIQLISESIFFFLIEVP